MSMKLMAVALIALAGRRRLRWQQEEVGGGSDDCDNGVDEFGSHDDGSIDNACLGTFASTKNCQQLMTLGVKMSEALRASAANGLSSIGDEADMFKALASAAPSEIRGDFETFATAILRTLRR